MKLIDKKNIAENRLPGRIIQNAVGRNSYSPSEKMTISYAKYSAESGPMEPHQHAEETVYVMDAKDAWVLYGPGKENLCNKVLLENEMCLHFPEMEWHVFQYGEGGHLRALCIYGQVDNIRPEDILQQR